MCVYTHTQTNIKPKNDGSFRFSEQGMISRKKVYGAEELILSWKIDVWLLTELSDAPHACGQQGLLNSPLLGLTVGVSSFIWALLVPVQAQTVWQTEDSCTKELNKKKKIMHSQGKCSS